MKNDKRQATSHMIIRIIAVSAQPFADNFRGNTE